MTMRATIGPINTTHPYLLEDAKPPTEGTEQFKIRVNKEQVQQIIGLRTRVVGQKDTNIKNLQIAEEGWGLIPVDGNEEMYDNSDIFPRGYYVLTGVEPGERGNPQRTPVTLTLEKINSNLDSYLYMDYTPGFVDGTYLDHTYDDSVKTTILTDNFATFDTTNNWETPITSGLTSSSITAASGKLVFAGTATVDKTPGVIYTTSRDYYKYPKYYIDFDFEEMSQSASDFHVQYFMLSSWKPTGYVDAYRPDYATKKLTGDCFVQVFMISYTSSTKYVVNINGTTTTYDLTAGQTTPTFRVLIDYDNVYIGVDVAGGTSFVEPGGASFGTTPHYMGGNGFKTKGAYISYIFRNDNNAAVTAKTNKLDVFRYEETNHNNVVCLPVTEYLDTPSDFTRTGLDGSIPCYINPDTDLFFAVDDMDEFYDGCVKAYTDNYSDDVERLITSPDVILDPTHFSVHNSLVKLETTETGVELYYYASGWVLLNTFTFDDSIYNIQLLDVNPERVRFRANRTVWTIQRGKQTVLVEHPTTDLNYTLRTCYFHDGGATTDPTANQSISMLTAYYTHVYSKGSGDCTTPDPADRYRLQILQQYPTTIKSDKIPATSVTGLGWYDDDDDTYGALFTAGEFFNQTRQCIGLKQP